MPSQPLQHGTWTRRGVHAFAGGTRPAAVICPAKKRLKRDAASMTALRALGTNLGRFHNLGI